MSAPVAVPSPDLRFDVGTTPASRAPTTADSTSSAPVTGPEPPSRSRSVLTWLAIVGFLTFLAFAGYWQLQGGKWVRVETSSMGTIAPVGSLLWVKPVDFDTLAPGDFITFHPPGRSQTFSHLVDARNADGTISTHGAISGEDPWTLHSTDVVGKVAMTWQGMGWLALMAPVLVGGLVLIALLRRLAPENSRLPVTLLFGAILVAGLLSYYRPLANAQQLAFKQVDDDSATVTFVGTGVLPVKLVPQDGGEPVTIRSGETGMLTLHGLVNDDGVAQQRHMVGVDIKGVTPWWLWAGLVGVVFTPAVADTLRRRARTEDEDDASDDVPEVSV